MGTVVQNLLWGKSSLLPPLWLFLTRSTKQTDGWDLEDRVSFSTLSLTSCAQPAIEGSTNPLPWEGSGSFLVWEELTIPEIHHKLPFRSPLETENRVQSNCVRQTVPGKLWSHWAAWLFLFSILWSSQNPHDVY